MGEYAAMSFASLKTDIRQLYEGATPQGVRFRYALLAFDVVTVLFIIVTSFLPFNEITEALDVLFGVVILTDFSARFWSAGTGCANSPVSRPGQILSQSFLSWPRSPGRPGASSVSCAPCGY